MSVYGYCPKCGAPGAARERRPNGNDRCENAHSYPSRDALKTPPESSEQAQGFERADLAKLLVAKVNDINAAHAEILLEGMTDDGKEIGDWRVTVARLDATQPQPDTTPPATCHNCGTQNVGWHRCAAPPESSEQAQGAVDCVGDTQFDSYYERHGYANAHNAGMGDKQRARDAYWHGYLEAQALATAGVPESMALVELQQVLELPNPGPMTWVAHTDMTTAQVKRLYSKGVDINAKHGTFTGQVHAIEQADGMAVAITGHGPNGGPSAQFLIACAHWIMKYGPGLLPK